MPLSERKIPRKTTGLHIPESLKDETRSAKGSVIHKINWMASLEMLTSVPAGCRVCWYAFARMCVYLYICYMYNYIEVLYTHTVYNIRYICTHRTYISMYDMYIHVYAPVLSYVGVYAK